MRASSRGGPTGPLVSRSHTRPPSHLLIIPLAHLMPLVLGPDPAETLGRALDPLSSAPCNVHLVLLLLDCVLGTLFPELLGDS